MSTYLPSNNTWRIVYFSLFFCSLSFSVAQAKDLYITDDYLRGLSDEVSDPEYIKDAKKDLLDSEKREQDQTTNPEEIRNALTSMYNFENLLRTKYQSTHSVYSTLPTSARILIYDEFKKTKKLSSAKRMIIKKYETK